MIDITDMECKIFFTFVGCIAMVAGLWIANSALVAVGFLVSCTGLVAVARSR